MAEANGKKVNNSNRTEIGLVYEVVKDSADTLLLKITYDKLDIHLKNNDQEQQMSAANASGSFNPVERLLGSIKGASVHITVTSKGDIVKVSGSKEIADTILASMNAQDEYVKKTVRENG